MSPDQLLAHFDRISEAPDAVARLRRFILDLAVRGKLVKQDPSDEPICLGYLQRRGLPKNQPSGRTGATLGPVTIEEVQLAIPEGWMWGRLHELCEDNAPIVYGILQPGPNIRPDGVPYIRPSEIEDGRINLRDIRHTSEDIAAKYSRATVRAGDVIMTIVGTLGATAVVPTALDGGNITQSSCRLRTDVQVINRDYLVSVLQSTCLTSQIERFKLGTAVPRLNIAHVRALAVPLPPVAEQHRIVAKVDELMALCDRLEAAQAERERRRERLTVATYSRISNSESQISDSEFLLRHLPRLTTRPEQIAQLRHSMMNLAISGKLVEQDAKDRPASEFLDRIRGEMDRTANAGALKTRQPPEVHRDETPFRLPSSWRWVHLGDLITSADAGWSPKTEGFARSGENWGVLKVSAVSWGKFLPEENKQLLPGVKTRESAQVHAGDFLISRANTSELVAKCVLVTEEPTKLILSDKIVRLKIATGCNPRFLCFVNNYAKYARDYYAEQASGTSLSMQNVSRGVIYALPVPLPPLAEQDRIVARIDELIALCDRVEDQLRTMQADKHRLLEAVLHEALASAA